EQLHRLTTVLSRPDRVPITLEQMRQELTHAKFIVDYENVRHRNLANEARSQEPEVTIKRKRVVETSVWVFLTAICQDRCAVSFKQSTGFFQLAHFKITVPVAQIRGENQIVATLL